MKMLQGAAAGGGFRLIVQRCVTAGAVALVLAAALLAARPAHAVESVNVRLDAPAIDLTAASERQ